MWILIAIAFSYILPAEIHSGRASQEIAFYVIAFGVLFVATLLRITYAFFKHRHDDQFFERLPRE